MSVAERLRAAMEARGLNASALQRQVADRGVRGASYGSVWAYLKGPSEPPLGFIREAATVLDVRPEWLAFGVNRVSDAGELVVAEIRAAKRSLEAAEAALRGDNR
jgi:transcriptional regulator with XRE-family HTH domain